MIRPKRKALARAYEKAGTLERPYIRLCADVPDEHDVDVDDVRKWAKESDRRGLFKIDQYSFALLQPVQNYLARTGFPYSYVEVDGLLFNRQVNIGLWQTKPDLPRIQGYDALSDVSIIEVFNGFASFDELADKMSLPEMNVWRAIASKADLINPPLLKPVFQETYGPSLAAGGPSRVRGYFLACPDVVELYGGSVDKWYRRFYRAGQEKSGIVKIALIDGELVIFGK